MRETPIVQNSLLPCVSHIVVLSGVQSQLEIHVTIKVFLEGLDLLKQAEGSIRTSTTTPELIEESILTLLNCTNGSAFLKSLVHLKFKLQTLNFSPLRDRASKQNQRLAHSMLCRKDAKVC